MKKWEAYWNAEGQYWAARQAASGSSLESAAGLAKALNAAAGRLKEEARLLARAWRVGELGAAYVGGLA